MKITKNTRLLNMYLFLLAIICKGLGDALLVKNNPYGSFNIVKYIILILAISIYAYELKKLRELGYKPIFKKEYYSLLKMIIILLIISVIYSALSSHFTFRMIKEFAFISVPIVFVYYAINILSFRQILRCAKISTIIYVISYILEIGIGNINFSYLINILKNISFAGGNTIVSSSMYESSYFADPIMALFCFFIYYKKDNNIWVWISYCLIIFMNKRALILFATLILIMSYLPKARKTIRKKFNKKVYIFFVIVFAISPFVIKIMTEVPTEIIIEKVTGINMADFWMGRDVMVRELISSGFKSYGLGSTFDFRGSLLEIESLKFLFETGIIGVTVISYYYWKLTDSHLYLISVMLYIFVNINTSTSIMTGAFAWIYYLFLIGCVKYNLGDNNR